MVFLNLSLHLLPQLGDGRSTNLRHSTDRDWFAVPFTLPDLPAWSFRIVLIGQHVILEAINEDQTLSTILDPLASRIHSAYGLIAHPQCVRMMR